ncbi:hypothetical protein HWA77_20305 [Photobacterium damselae subsp. damselae]|uniref:Uncharacterized protein n=1 Tax=Photobacterium damselae subsp. damselae TaxID=85581 RepID=A0A850QSB0_PHODD|nr:hypothetical protein [Photobacterium damselae subsp. damselae]
MGHIPLYGNTVPQEQIARIIAHKEDMEELLDEGRLHQIQKGGQLESSDSFLIHSIAKDLVTNKLAWNGLGYLYKVIRLSPSGWGGLYSKFVGFVKVLSENWSLMPP